MSSERRDIRLHTAGAITVLAWSALAFASHRLTPVPIAFTLVILSVAWGVAFMLCGREPVHSRSLLLAWSALAHLAACTSRPVYEDDHWRYLWDGHVFATLGTPYGVAPMEWFTRGDVPVAMQQVLDGINHPELPTIYGPIPEWAFLASHALSPGERWPLQLILVACSLATIAMLLPRAGRWAPLVAWCPLLMFETGVNAHFESLGLLALTGAMIAAERKRGAWAGVLAGIACLTRPFAGLIALPLALRGGWKVVVGALVTLIAITLPFVWRGHGIGLESLGAFLADWEYDSSLYALLHAAIGDAARLVCAVLLALGIGVLLVLARQEDPAWPRGEWMLALFFLLSPVVNPWYVLWLLPFVAIRPTRWGFTALAAASLAYVNGWNLPGASPGYEHPFWLRPLQYGVVVLAAALDWRAAGSEGQRQG